MIGANRTRELIYDVMVWTLISLGALGGAVVVWLLVLSALASPPSTPQLAQYTEHPVLTRFGTVGGPLNTPQKECRHIHDGEVLVSSTLHPDGTLACTYIEASAIYGRATLTRPGK